MIEIFSEEIHISTTEEIEKLRTDNARLRKALEPFAEKGTYFCDRKIYKNSEIVNFSVSIGDLRRARAALNGDERK